MKSVSLSTLARRLHDFDDEPTPVIETLGALVRDPAVTVDRGAPIAQIRRMLVELRVPAVAVVDATDTLCGLVTRTDVLRTTDADATAADAMSGFVFSLPSYAPIGKAGRQSRRHRVRRRHRALLRDQQHVVFRRVSTRTARASR